MVFHELVCQVGGCWFDGGGVQQCQDRVVVVFVILCLHD